jgi:hypothetical protein
MAKTVIKKKNSASARMAAVPEKFKVVAGGRQGPKPGREAKKSARKPRAERKARAPRKARTPMPPVNDTILPKDFAKMVLEMASSPGGVTRAMLARRAGQNQVAWRPWVERLATSNGLAYSVSGGKPVFKLTKIAVRKRA